MALSYYKNVAEHCQVVDMGRKSISWWGMAGHAGQGNMVNSNVHSKDTGRGEALHFWFMTSIWFKWSVGDFVNPSVIVVVASS